MTEEKRSGIISSLIKFILMVGPGIFCVGYTIGTGSVTSMIVAGSGYGMQLLWVVALSCLFSGILMEAYGRFALVTGKTALNSFRQELPCGNFFAILILLMVVAGQWCCLSGLVGLSSHAIYEGLFLLWPGLRDLLHGGSYYAIISIAVLMLGLLYLLFWFGSYARLEKVLVVLVTMLALSFLLSLFLVAPSMGQVAGGMIPQIPKVDGAALLVAAMVGTTFAAPTFVVRPLLVLSKGWGIGDLRLQRRDAIISALTMFIISGSIMCCSAAVVFNRGGAPVKAVLDLVEPLKPIGGDFAVVLLLLGMVSAGVSSILPIAMVAGFLLGDYRNGTISVKAPVFRTLTAVACLIGLTVPILGSNPIAAQIITQISQVFVLPLIIGCIFIMVNRKKVMGENRAGILLNLGMITAFVFSLGISWTAVDALMKLIYHH